MTNKYKYFVENWKMFGDIKTINSINKIKSFEPAPFESDHRVHTFILPVNYILEN